MPSVFVVSRVAIYREGVAAYLGNLPGLTIAGVADSLTLDAALSDVCVVDRINIAFDEVAVFFDAMHRRQTPVVVIGVTREHGDVMSMLQAGASGYVTRDQSLAELHRAVLDTLRFGACVEPDDVPALLRQLRRAHIAHEGQATRVVEALTTREREVASLICQHFPTRKSRPNWEYRFTRPSTMCAPHSRSWVSIAGLM